MENKKFLDLDGLEYYNGKIQDKIDEKVDISSMSDYYTKAQTDANIAVETTARQSIDANLQAQINGLSSGAPLPASSTAEMTDTSRVYVNTTDGHWYYWDGSAWADGGVYQGTAAAVGSVYYNALTDVAANDEYETMSAEDLLWIDGYNWYNGQNTTASDTTSSPVFRVSKNTVIEISNVFRCRLTFWDIDGNYIGNTGSYAVHESYTVEQDGWMTVCLATNPQSSGFINRADLTNENVKIKALRNGRYKFIQDNIVFRRYISTQVQSSLVYVGKGTTVKGYGFGIKNSGGTVQDAMEALYVRCIARDQITEITYRNWDNRTNYTVEQDCYIQIRGRKKGAGAITDDEIDYFNKLYEIDYVAPSVPEIPLENIKNYQAYIGNNSLVETVETGGFGYEGHVLLRWEDALLVCKANTAIVNLTIAQAQAMFPDNAIEFNNKQWIRIPSNQMLYLDKLDDTIKLGTWRTPNITGETYPLLVNAYQNICGGAIYEVWLKQRGDASAIFNSVDYMSNVDWLSETKEFNALVNTNATNIETFVFFTDPHLMGGASSDYSATLNRRIGTLQKLYNSTPTNFIVGGGDWLNNGDTPDQACFKLGYIDGFMNSMFDGYHAVVGNHDTNYQGTEQLSNNTIINLWFREGGKAYYSFDGVHTKNYVLDSGLDWDYSTMSAYRWEQVDWLANRLLSDDPQHSIVFMHIVWNSSTTFVIAALADNITKVISAFNSRQSITLNGVTYDFAGKTGHVDYVMCGHIHDDHDGTVNGVKCIATTNFGRTVPSFDLVLNDYDNNTVKIVRVGTGSNREFNI